ncbi:MAG: S41 family peptidase [Lysobacterales bacterium]
MVRPIFALSVSLVLAMTATSEARTRVLSPAMQAYEDVTPLRDAHSDVIYDGAAATPEQLRAILVDLDQGLAKLGTPLYRDLGEGNEYLRYRRFNFLIDKVKIHARLNEVPEALAAWEALQTMAWLPEITPFVSDGNVQRLIADPRYSAIRAQSDLAARWAAYPALRTPYREQLPAAERIAGLSLIWSVARENFVWFDQVPELDWDQAYLETLPKVIAAEDTAAYYRELMRFVARLKDGHSNAYPPEELAPAMYSRPGLRTALVEDKVLILEVRDPALAHLGVKVGDEIVSIDGQPVRDYANERVAPYQSSSTPQDLAVRSYSYGLLAGAAGQAVQLQLRSAAGKLLEVSAPRSGYERTPGRASESFELRRDGVAVLRASHFESNAAHQLMLKYWPELSKAKALILDLRGNGGGSSNHGWDLLTHLSDQPLVTPASFYREASPISRAGNGDNASLKWRTIEDQPYEGRDARKFRRPVAMLIDARTFSAAEDTAAAFKLMQRGPIVGVASGGSSGQPLALPLPGGGSARICVKRDTYPDGSHFVGVGVLPDIEVAPTVASVRSGRDPELETAVQALLSTGPR